MSQGRTKQAWVEMAKLVPTAVHAKIDNDGQENVEISKVGQLVISCYYLFKLKIKVINFY